MLEDKIRTALRAEGGRLSQVGPLRLPPAGAARAARRVPRAARRDWPCGRTWLVPAAAAFMVAVVAVGLVTVRSALNPARTAAGPSAATAAVPRYGVALAGSVSHGASSLVVTDVLRGTTVTNVTAPRGSSYFGVSGAADDRTFAVGATLAGEPSLPAHGRTGPTGWYLLQISPGAPAPARLTRLPIPASAKDSPVGLFALSPSAKEIAVLSGNSPGVGAIIGFEGWLRVYSVSTGRLLRAWTPLSSTDGVFGIATALTWIHGGSGLAFTVQDETTSPVRQEVRVMDMTTGDASGKAALAAAAAAGHSYPGAADMLADSQVTWYQDTAVAPCQDATLTPDGSAVVCASREQAAGKPAELLWLAYQVSEPRASHVVGRLRSSQPLRAGDPFATGGPQVLWVSADGSTLLAGWAAAMTKQPQLGPVVSPPSEAWSVYAGVASDGRLTSLPPNPIVILRSIQGPNAVAL